MRNTATKHYPEVDLGHALKRERARSTVSPVINETADLYVLSDPRPGALSRLSERGYIFLVNKIALCLETLMGETLEGKKCFHRQTFYEAAGTVEGKMNNG